MTKKLRTTKEAAEALGISVLTLYDWLNQSDAGCFVLRGQPVSIKYLQGGPRGQGRIKIEDQEIERLLSLMCVTPKPTAARKEPRTKPTLRHITAKLGRPDE